jgi:deferrochelatase/peroxidase EfeB
VPDDALLGRRWKTSRRGLLTLGGAAQAGRAAVASGALAGCEDKPATPVSDRVPYYGAHQAGITTPAQARLAFASYDLTVDVTVAENRAALKALLTTWSEAAAMTDGRPVPGDSQGSAGAARRHRGGVGRLAG